MVVPREKMHFHTSELLRNATCRSVSIFMRHGPSRVATELSKACKILIFGRSLQPWTELRGTREQSGSGPIRSKSGVTQRVERGTQAINTDRQGPKASEFGAERRQRCKSQTKQGRRVFKSSLKQIKSQFHRDFTLKFSVVVFRIERSRNDAFLITRRSCACKRMQKRRILMPFQRGQTSMSGAV